LLFIPGLRWMLWLEVLESILTGLDLRIFRLSSPWPSGGRVQGGTQSVSMSRSLLLASSCGSFNSDKRLFSSLSSLSEF